ncbi:MAG: glycosyltransferase family 4 protein [Chloroflexota bacterium]|nr:MAG: glycosyltransferase family 4 protein [Chloroflexota bacterium]
MIEDSNIFHGRIAIQQRVLAKYRVGFFDSLAKACENGLGVFAGDVYQEESIPTAERLQIAEYFKLRNIHFLTTESPYYLLWQAGLIDKLREWNPDVLIVEANPRYLSTDRGIRWMKRRGRAVIGWGLGAPPIARPPAWFGGKFADRRIRSRRMFIQQLDGLIAYSHRGAAEYLSIAKPNQKVFVATNAVASRPSGQFSQRPPEFEARARVLYVGRLQSRKRIDNLIRACSALPDKLQPMLWIVGDGPARRSLEELANRIFPAAEFPGSKFGAELEMFFSKADLFVLPGTGGLAVQQAMAHGLPVIVAEGDGTQEDLVKANNGWLIPADDEAGLRNALQEALSDPERLRIMGGRSYKVVQEEVNVDQMVKVFVQAVKSIGGDIS